LIEVAVELIGTSHHRDQIGHVMRYVPTVYPGIVFAVVGTRPLSARKTIIERFDKLTFFVFWMKEAGFCIVKITVVQRIFLKHALIFFLSKEAGELRKRPLVVGSAQRNGNRLPFFKTMHFRYGFFFTFLQSGDISAFFVKGI